MRPQHEAEGALSLHGQFGPQPDGRRAASSSGWPAVRGRQCRDPSGRAQPDGRRGDEGAGHRYLVSSLEAPRRVLWRLVRLRHHGLRSGGTGLSRAASGHGVPALELPGPGSNTWNAGGTTLGVPTRARPTRRTDRSVSAILISAFWNNTIAAF